MADHNIDHQATLATVSALITGMKVTGGDVEALERVMARLKRLHTIEQHLHDLLGRIDSEKERHYGRYDGPTMSQKRVAAGRALLDLMGVRHGR